MRQRLYISAAAVCLCVVAVASASDIKRPSPDRLTSPKVPGVVIDYSPAKTKIYLGGPSIAVLPNGDYVASHSFFGPGSKKNRIAVFCSHDKGNTWQKLTELVGQYWSNLFVHNGALYIMGTDRQYGRPVVRRSKDGGKTWTTPNDRTTGLLSDAGGYHTAPVPVAVHNGRICRAMEYKEADARWGRFQAFVMSAPADANLLNRENWTFSNRLIFEKQWARGEGNPGWLEGNIVVTPENKLVNILRLNFQQGEKAAVIHISEDGETISFNPEKDIIDFPGGATKFTIRYDKISKRYWSLTNFIPKRDETVKASLHRNVLALTSSVDLKNWEVESIILQHPDVKKHAFQYVDWLIEGNDIIFVSRTAYDDAFSGAHRQHDANYFTFHRIKHFRQYKSKIPQSNNSGQGISIKIAHSGLLFRLRRMSRISRYLQAGLPAPMTPLLARQISNFAVLRESVDGLMFWCR